MRPRLHAKLRLLCQIWLLCLIEVAACIAPVHAADWLTVASDRIRRVELDRASIMPSDSGTKVAWGRIVLSDEQAKAFGYRTVRALNRYDCRSHTFIIVSRVYLASDDSTLREDKIDATSPISVKTGTVDDKFFNEVCKPASVEALRDTAKKAAEGIAKAEENSKPLLRRADIQLAREEPPAATQPAVPTKPAATESTSAPAATAPDAKPAKGGEATGTRRRQAERLAAERAGQTAPTTPPPETHSPTPAPTPATAPAHTEAHPPPRKEPPATRKAPAAEHKTPHASTTHPPTTAKTGKAAANTKKGEAHSPHATDALHNLHWSYEGQAGPENWSKIDPEFSVCSLGKRQSPIDIRDGIKVDQEPIQFDYQPTYFRIVDNGHTIQVNYGPGSRITVMGRTYELIQFHFHHPAEEQVNGKSFAMVAHLVHRDAEGRLAVVAVLLEPGQANKMIQTLWNNVPLEKNEDYSPKVSIQIADLLPKTQDFYSYIGSLTTPPCSEGVLWLVLKQAVEISAEQISVFSRFYPNNARPIQNASGRVIKESR